MIDEKEYDLMLDLAKLLRKHGPQVFESLAGTLSSPEFVEKFTAILMGTARIGRAHVSNRSPLVRELNRLKEVEPKKYEIIKSFMAEFAAGQILPSLKDVNRFVAENGLPEIKATSRSRSISQLVHSLLKLPSEQLGKILAGLVKGRRSDSSLSEWSEIITKGMSRSTKQK
ncbi:MAG TPA: hypothetical protein VK487_05950 [Candidatus Bathyarchaeia archaeon]|nr:hypothetical protein [Candidatus Bathyarchaeia archaeon]